MSAGPSSGITFSGLSSGIDVNGIVTQLMNLERRSVTRLQVQRQSIEADRLVYDNLRSNLATFTGSLSSLALPSAFATFSGASSEEDVATVTASSGASPGTYSLDVRKLAQSHKISSTAQADTSSALNLTGTFSVNGKEVTVEAGDSLATIAGRINSADAGVTASLINGGTGKAFLTLTAKESGASNAITVADVSGGALAGLGSFGTTITAAQDAEYRLDGLELTSSTNSITDVVPGATITLKKAALDGSAVSTLTVSQDTGAFKNKVKDLVNAYNSVVGFIRDNSRFDTDTYESGPLFGDATAAQVESALNAALFGTKETGTFRNVTQIGFGIDEDGKITLDESALDKAITTDSEAVRDLLAPSGESANPSLRFISASIASKSSIGSGYDVNITQAATKSTGSAGTIQTSNSTGGETLTFGGTLFNNRDILLTVAGGSAADLVQQINNDSRLKDAITASLDGDGRLTFTANRFGAASAFTVLSDQAAASDNSGIGTTGATVTAGLDVAGTINGEAATGNGQFLMGQTGNATTEGLQIMYTGNTVGNVGTFRFNSGLANTLNRAAQTFTDSVNGILTASNRSFQNQIEDMDTRIAALNESLVVKEADLRARFTRMEEAITRSQSQGSQFASFISGLQGSR
ncbi:MAG: flagellar filament capping protein FliD [Fimbriimonadaceae bacterium]|nr:flagellar filament capping protein FliD [Fimbriimonadaceae bacterium]